MEQVRSDGDASGGRAEVEGKEVIMVVKEAGKGGGRKNKVSLHQVTQCARVRAAAHVQASGFQFAEIKLTSIKTSHVPINRRGFLSRRRNDGATRQPRFFPPPSSALAP